jgi:hypothetical protein
MQAAGALLSYLVRVASYFGVTRTELQSYRLTELPSGELVTLYQPLFVSVCKVLVRSY